MFRNSFRVSVFAFLISEDIKLGVGEGVVVPVRALGLEEAVEVGENKDLLTSNISSSSSKSGTGNLEGSGDFKNALEAKCISEVGLMDLSPFLLLEDEARGGETRPPALLF